MGTGLLHLHQVPGVQGMPIQMVFRAVTVIVIPKNASFYKVLHTAYKATLYTYNITLVDYCKSVACA